MFGIFKKKKKNVEEVYSPCLGRIVQIEDVPDPVFSEKMMGDGIAIEPTEGKIYAPFDGEVIQVFNTKHAITLKSNKGTNLLIHIGLETVNLEGAPFDVKIKNGQAISKGQLLVDVDLEYIKSKGLKTITPIILVNEGGEEKVIIEKDKNTSATINDVLMKIE